MVGVHKVKGNQDHQCQLSALVALSLMLCIRNYSCMSPRSPALPTTTSHTLTTTASPEGRQATWQPSLQPTTTPPPCKACATVSETQGSCLRHPPLSWGPFPVVSSLLSSKISLLDHPLFSELRDPPSSLLGTLFLRSSLAKSPGLPTHLCTPPAGTSDFSQLLLVLSLPDPLPTKISPTPTFAPGGQRHVRGHRHMYGCMCMLHVQTHFMHVLHACVHLHGCGG